MMMDERTLNLTLNEYVFRLIGLELDNQYNVIDQDTRYQLQINGKFIKYFFGNNPEVLDFNDKIFDAVHDSYTMNFLISYYIEKLKMEGSDIYIHSYHPVLNKMDRTSALEFKGECEGRPFQTITKFYKNDCLKFIEGLFILSGDGIDLSKEDALLLKYEEETLKEMKRIERSMARRRKTKNDKVQPGTIHFD